MKKIINDGKLTFGALDTCNGRLSHAAFVIPLSRHFLSRINKRLHPARHKRQEITLSREEKEDLRIWLQFLLLAKKGISLNSIVHRYPSKLCISDSCPFGLGGFLWTGRAWRLFIPSRTAVYGNDIAKNALEFLALAITILLQLHEANNDSECILAVGDNTSALGWLFRSSQLGPTSPYYTTVLFIARYIASAILASPHCLFGQHIKGNNNVVADLLSFLFQLQDGDKRNPVAYDCPDNVKLTRRFHQYTPQLIPRNFHITPLPSHILFFATQALQTLE